MKMTSHKRSLGRGAIQHCSEMYRKEKGELFWAFGKWALVEKIRVLERVEHARKIQESLRTQ